MITGYRALAVVLGLVEVTVWIFAVGGAVKYLSHPLAVLGYAGGFGVGVLAGMMLEEKLAFGYRIVRVISNRADLDVATLLRNEGYRVTRVEGSGMSGPVEISFLVIRRKELPQLRKLMNERIPEAFLSIERVEIAQSVQSVTSDSRFSKSLLGRIVVRK